VAALVWWGVGVMDLEAAFSQAVAHHRSGRVGEAEGLCRSIMAEAPGHARALHLLGAIRFAGGQAEEAIGLLERAVAAKPDYGEAEFNLGVMLAAADRLEDAARHFGRACELRPENSDAHIRLGAALMELDHPAAAEASFLKALALRPEDPLILTDLAAVALDQGHADAAADYARRAIARAPDLPQAHLRLGRALDAQGADDEMLVHFRRACELDPSSAHAASLLTMALFGRQQLDAAEALGRDTLAKHPENARALANLATILMVKGEVAEAIRLFRRAIELEPDRVDYHRPLQIALLYSPDALPAERFAARAAFGHAVTAHIVQPLRPEPRDRSPDRKLRVGWLSSDFRNHPVARNLELLFASRNRANFEAFGYGEITRPDAVTAWFQAQTDAWRSTIGLSDREVAEQIQADRIDIMVYLAGCFDNNRPQIAGWRPAPIQVSLFDAATSGLTAMDYFIADSVMVPRPRTERFTERVLRLPSFAVQPPIDWTAASTPPPCLTAGHITFGSLSNPAKLNHRVLALWADILRRVPGSRLRLKYRQNYANPGMRDRVRRDLGPDAADRVEFDEVDDFMDKHLTAYDRIDVALDPFPFTGATTTFEALWMGVPVVTLLGDHFMARWASSMISKVGLTDLIARSPEEYVAVAVGLAADVERLRMLRTGALRERVRTSALCDGRRAMRYMERGFRAIWRKWCQDANPTQ
jgi:protein O-GlcNAc transferase